MKDFWAWATVHYWMTFLVALSVSKTIRTIFKSVCRIWWPPSPVTVDLTGQNGQQVSRPSVSIPAAPPQPASTFIRRNMWKRLMDD